jgi:hypothetical protein
MQPLVDNLIFLLSLLIVRLRCPLPGSFERELDD